MRYHYPYETRARTTRARKRKKAAKNDKLLDPSYAVHGQPQTFGRPDRRAETARVGNTWLTRTTSLNIKVNSDTSP